MPRGGRNIPSLRQRFALKGKMLVKKYKGQLVVQSWPKPYGPARSQAQLNTQIAFKRFQRAVKFFPPQQIITAMELTAGTGMYPRDLMMAASLGTNVMLGYADQGAVPMIGDGLDKFTAVGGETTIDFQNIPLGYTSLRLSATMRTTVNATFENLTATFNGDTAAHYDYSGWFPPSGTFSGFAQTSVPLASVNGATAPANYPTAIEIFMPGYAGPFYKHFQSIQSRIQAVSAGNVIQDYLLGYWRSVSPISRITLTTPHGMVAGSTVTLYGFF